MNMKVSVIIPVYNVEKYLFRCVKSVIDQTYENIEIILIDDGSEDNSGKLCDNYVQLDNRIKVIHQQNGGLSSARNKGIELATGDAICFLDSDDYISKGCIEEMTSLMEKYNADVSIIQMKYIREDENEESQSEGKLIKVLDSQDAIEESLYQRNFTCCAPAKLYKRSVIGEVRFPVGRISEDLATCHLFLDNADWIVYSDYYGYYYRQHATSIMHIFNPRRLDALKWARSIERFCAEKYPQICVATYCRTFNVAVHLLLDLPDQGKVHDKYIHEIWNEVKRTRLKTLFNRKARIREKIAIILSFGGEKLLKMVWNSKVAIRKD